VSLNLYRRNAVEIFVIDNALISVMFIMSMGQVVLRIGSFDVIL